MAVVCDATAPQDIIEDDDAAGTHELQAALVVLPIVSLVGVDESKVKATGTVARNERIERLGRGGKSQVDFLGQACFAPIFAGRGSYRAALMSQAMSLPSGGRALAMASAP